jgi:hypothetical protein
MKRFLVIVEFLEPHTSVVWSLHEEITQKKKPWNVFGLQFKWGNVHSDRVFGGKAGTGVGVTSVCIGTFETIATESMSRVST